MGARHGYSILNGVIITLLCLFGGVTLFLKYIPQECILGILLWIAIIITAQAFMEIPKEHGLAVAFGLIPAFAAFTFEVVVKQTLLVTKTPLSAVSETLNDPTNPIHLHGLIALSQGFLLTSMVFASMMVYMIDRKFDRAAYWAFGAAGLSMTGLIHAYQLNGPWIQNKFGLFAAPEFGLIYFLVGGVFLMLHYRQKSDSKPTRRKGKKLKKEPEPEPEPTPAKSKVSYV
jgi:AGZA family xanthine/uracil permease-like MFS transporter